MPTSGEATLPEQGLEVAVEGRGGGHPVGVVELHQGGAARLGEPNVHLGHAGTMSRAEATEVLAQAGIDGGGQRTYHLLVRHCQSGLLCQGPIRASATGALVPTFVLHDEWVRSPNRPGREQALALLAERYVASHGPVTERDFAGWCDQPLRVAREAVALTDGRVHSVRLGDAAYLVHADAGDPGELGTHRGALLVPGFDEWLLGYKDRAAQLTPEQAARVVPGGNGLFRGTLVAGGLVVGTWRRTLTRAGVTVEVTPFGPVGVTARRAAGRAVAAYGRFLGVAATLRTTGYSGSPRIGMPCPASWALRSL